MKDKNSKETRIVIGRNKTITRDELFRKKEEFHRNQAKLSFDKKVKMVTQLQKIARNLKASNFPTSESRHRKSSKK